MRAPWSSKAWCGLWLLLAGACAGTPARPGQRDPVAAAGRVLHHLASPQRLASPAALAASARAELLRLPAVPHRAEQLAATEVRRAAGLPDHLTASATTLLGPRWPHGSVWHRFGPDRALGQLLDGLAEAPTLLGAGRRPLSEPSDRDHRTDPHDDRPELGLLPRLARRIPW